MRPSKALNVTAMKLCESHIGHLSPNRSKCLMGSGMVGAHNQFGGKNIFKIIYGR